jgi:hypothetical protein
MLITIPPWIFKEKKRDNWQSGPWDRAIQARSLAGLGKGVAQPVKVDEHF